MTARHYQIGGLKVPKSEITKVHDHIMVVRHEKTFTGHKKERKKEKKKKERDRQLYVLSGENRIVRLKTK
jgi:hypothetical protein